MLRHIAPFLVAALPLVFMPGTLNAAMIYKCKNEEGAYIYQKTACHGDADTVSSWTPKEAALPVVQESETEKDKNLKNESPVSMKLKQGIT